MTMNEIVTPKAQVGRTRDLSWPNLRIQLTSDFQVTGLVTDDPVTFPTPEIMTVLFAEDQAEQATMSKAHYGGMMSIRMVPTSKSVYRFCQDLARSQENGSTVFYNVSPPTQTGRGAPAWFGPTSGKPWKTLLHGCRLSKCPPAPRPGQTFEVELFVAEYVPVFVGTDFPAPGSVSVGTVE